MQTVKKKPDKKSSFVIRREFTISCPHFFPLCPFLLSTEEVATEEEEQEQCDSLTLFLREGKYC